MNGGGAAAVLALASGAAAPDAREAAHSHSGDPAARAWLVGACADRRAATAALRGANAAVHAGFEAAPTGTGEGADPELAALIDAAGWRRDAVSLARGRIHHYTAGATRSVLDALHDGDALSAAYHDLIASGLWRSELRTVLEDAVGELDRAYTLALRTVCRHPSEAIGPGR